MKELFALYDICVYISVNTRGIHPFITMAALFAILFAIGQQYALSIVVAGVFFGSICDSTPQRPEAAKWIHTIAWVAIYIMVGLNIHWYAAILLQCAYDYMMYSKETRDSMSYNRAWMYLIALFWGETIEEYTAIILGVSVAHLAWMWYRR
jgi:hypothetical protein